MGFAVWDKLQETCFEVIRGLHGPVACLKIYLQATFTHT